MGYKYQLHTHTSPCSKCGAMTPDELAEALFSGGYSGCVLTNHFYGGNTGIDRNLPWEEFVAAYEKDYRECRAAAEKYGLDIIFGVEEHLYGGLEILCYGITPKMLYDNPILKERRPEDWYNISHGYDALVIQAHPFRSRTYITVPGVLPLEYIDGIEVCNCSNAPEANDAAEDFARLHPELILTSGADTHSPSTVTLGGIISPERIRCTEELATLLRSGNYEIIKK